MGSLTNLLALFSNVPSLMHLFPQLHSTVPSSIVRGVENAMIYDALVGGLDDESSLYKG